MEFEDFLPLILGLFIICGVLLAFYWILKKMTGKANRLSAGKYARIIDRIAISQDKQIQLVEIGEYVLVIGISSSSVNLLYKVKKENLKQFEQDISNPQFKDIFSNFLSRLKDNERKL